jgi:hypothetical protein
MKTSLNDTQTTELYLEGKLSPLSRMLFDARLKINPELRKNLETQKKTYWMVKLYHRKKLKEELNGLYHHLFQDPGKKDFQKGILEIFG